METEILRAKYRTVNRYVRRRDEAARWVAEQTELAVVTQGGDACALVARLIAVIEQVMRPGPSVELIADELEETLAGMPEALSKAGLVEAMMQSTQRRLEEFKELAAVGGAYCLDQQALIDCLQKRTQAVVDHLRLGVEVGRRLRDRLTEQLVRPERGVTWSELTEAERRLVGALGDRHLTGEELSEAVGRSFSGPFKSVLSNLVKRKVLVNDRTGYSVHPRFDVGRVQCRVLDRPFDAPPR